MFPRRLGKHFRTVLKSVPQVTLRRNRTVQHVRLSDTRGGGKTRFWFVTGWISPRNARMGFRPVRRSLFLPSDSACVLDRQRVSAWLGRREERFFQSPPHLGGEGFRGTDSEDDNKDSP